MMHLISIWLILASFLFIKDEPSYLSPERVVYDSEKGLCYVSLSTAGKVVLMDPEKEKVLDEFRIPFNPEGMALSEDGDMLYVSGGYEQGRVLFLDTKTKIRLASIPVGHSPGDISLAKGKGYLFVSNRYSNDISVISISSQTEIGRIPVVREPMAVAVSPDEKLVAVANFLPGEVSGDKSIAAKVSLIGVETLELIEQISLPTGSSALRDLCFSKDGAFLYVTHQLSRYFVPATQLNRGWLNNSALSVIDATSKEYITTVLLDDPEKGAAGPCGIDISDNNSRIFISLAGTHELCIIDRTGMQKKIESLSAEDREEIPNSLTFLSEFKTRIPLKGKSPRYLVVHKERIMIPTYYSTGLHVIHTEEPYRAAFISLGEEPASSPERLGEQHFHDASLAYQGWQSCATCHLGGGRVDGLSWDLPGDGFGNPKNTKSLLTSHQTPPVNHTGNVPDLSSAVRSGIKGSIYVHLDESYALELEAYLASLEPLPSPFLEQGLPSESADRGEAVFQRVGCAACHTGAYFSNLKKYNVGTGILREKDLEFDTPTLLEMWRTAPYLHDGRAASLEDMLTLHNPDDRHGKTSGLSKDELNDLINYVLSL